MRFSLSAFFTDLSFGLAFMCNTVECEDRGRADILNVVIVVIDIALLDLVPAENGSEGLRHPVAGLHQPAIADGMLRLVASAFPEIGRATCRQSVAQSLYISGVAESIKKQ